MYSRLLQGIFLSYLFMWEPLKYGEDIEYPFYMHAIGFVMSLASMLWIPGYAIYYVISQRGSLRDVRERNAPLKIYCKAHIDGVS